ncbi:MAG: hypothetical protein ACTHKS_16750 [Gaiellaceae bacterium]
MDAGQVSKLLALTDANHLILELASASPEGGRVWQFFCECGRADCHEQVALTLPEDVSRMDDHQAILASGHLVDQKERARVLREHALALRAQAELQMSRAKRNLRRRWP